MRTAAIFLAFLWLGFGFSAGQQLQVRQIPGSLANIFLIEYAGKRLLVDAGEAPHAEKIAANLHKKDIDPGSIDYLLVTHGHADHAGGAHYFQQNFGIQVIAGTADTNLFRQGHNPPLKATSNFGVWVDKHIVKNDEFPGFKPDILVVDTLDLHPLGFPATVRVLPGHTAGSLVLLFEEQAFVGDIIRGALLAKKAPRRHFFHEDAAGAEAHLHSLLAAGITTFYPGHGGPLKAKRVRKYLSSTATPSDPSSPSHVSN